MLRARPRRPRVPSTPSAPAVRTPARLDCCGGDLGFDAGTPQDDASNTRTTCHHLFTARCSGTGESSHTSSQRVVRALLTPTGAPAMVLQVTSLAPEMLNRCATPRALPTRKFAVELVSEVVPNALTSLVQNDIRGQQRLW